MDIPSHFSIQWHPISNGSIPCSGCKGFLIIYVSLLKETTCNKFGRVFIYTSINNMFDIVDPFWGEFPSFSWLIKYFSKEIFGETKSYCKANLIDPRSLGRGGLGFISHILLIHSRYFCSLSGHDSLSPLEVDNLIFNNCWLLGWRSIFLEGPRSIILVLLFLILDSRVHPWCST